MTQSRKEVLKVVVHWSLLVLTVFYLVSGLGITQYRTVEVLTFGLLTRSLAFRIHGDLLIPFFALLFLHVIVEPVTRVYSRMKRHSS